MKKFTIKINLVIDFQMKAKINLVIDFQMKKFTIKT